MWTRAFLIACVAALPVAAQDVPALPPELLDMSDLPEVAAPGWLSDTVTRPHADIGLVRPAAPRLTVMPLGAVTLDAVGLLPGSITGFARVALGGRPRSRRWPGCSARNRCRGCPRIQSFTETLALAELPPPADALPDRPQLLLARIDMLLGRGALDPGAGADRTGGRRRPRGVSAAGSMWPF